MLLFVAIRGVVCPIFLLRSPIFPPSLSAHMLRKGAGASKDRPCSLSRPFYMRARKGRPYRLNSFGQHTRKTYSEGSRFLLSAIARATSFCSNKSFRKTGFIGTSLQGRPCRALNYYVPIEINVIPLNTKKLFRPWTNSGMPKAMQGNPDVKSRMIEDLLRPSTVKETSRCFSMLSSFVHFPRGFFVVCPRLTPYAKISSGKTCTVAG